MIVSRKLARVAAFTGLLLATPVTAATLIVNGSGQLAGATGVNVNGTLYDVTFVDGTCPQVFGGCDSPSDFAFSTSADAGAAAQALLSQVFIDTALGDFDSDYTKTVGCETNVYSECTILTPFSFDLGGAYVGASTASNYNIEANDQQYADSYVQISVFDLTYYPSFVWARFTPAAVPEPSTWTLMLLGFGAVGVAVRRGRKTRLSQLA